MPSRPFATALWTRLIGRVEALEPELEDAFMEAIREIGDNVDIPALVHHLELGQVEAAADVILEQADAWSRLSDAAYRALTRVAGEGTVMVDLVTGQPIARFTVATGLDQFSATITDHLSELIVEVDKATRVGVTRFIERSLASGQNPASLVPQLVGYVQPDGSRKGGIIGLTEQQSNAVFNYRSALENRSITALDRALRDARFDASAEANAARLRGGSTNPNYRPLTPDQIDNLVTRYESRMLAYRGETIARTEAMRAQRAGQRLGWEAAIDSGHVAPEDLRRTWVTAGDNRVRPEHVAMEGVTVGYDEPFITEDEGAILNPSAPNCRCVVWIQPAAGSSMGTTVQQGTPDPSEDDT